MYREEVHIENLVFVPVVERNPMVQRNLELNVTQQDINNIAQMYDQTTSGRISAIDLARNAPNALRMNDVASREVQIVNGWGQQRYRFMMTVATKKSNGSIFRSYIQGYTDYADTSLSGMIDPAITLIFNSMINTVTTYDPMSNSNSARPVSSFSIIFDTLSHSYTYKNDDTTLRLVRPIDVVNNLETLNNVGGAEVINTTSRHTHMPSASNMKNRTGSEHMASVLNSMSVGSRVTDIGYESADTYMNAKSIVSETNLSSIPVVVAISELKNETLSATVSISQLGALDPNVSNVTFVSEKRQTPVNLDTSVLTTNDTESLRSVSKEATIAAMVADMATGMLVESMLTTITFSITNMTPDGSIVEQVMDFNSIIQDIDKRPLIERFIGKFANIVMPNITEANLLGVEIMATLDVAVEAKISVYIAGSTPVVFSVPVYADSLFTSVVADQVSENRSMTEFGNLVNMVTNIN